jgi:hypothetical protein
MFIWNIALKILVLSSFLLVFSACNTEKDNSKIDSQIENTNNENSKLTCPYCNSIFIETLPNEYCLIKYTCAKCSKNIYPKEGDCCVFCSYGTHKCPSIQEKNQ